MDHLPAFMFPALIISFAAVVANDSILVHLHNIVYTTISHSHREIFRAVSDLDAEELEALGEDKGNFNCRNSEGLTPLHRAADRNTEEVCLVWEEVRRRGRGRRGRGRRRRRGRTIMIIIPALVFNPSFFLFTPSHSTPLDPSCR